MRNWINMSGFSGSEDIIDYCPYCKTKTPQVIQWEDDINGQSCSICENEVIKNDN